MNTFVKLGLSSLSRRWKGSAIDIVVDGQTHTIGQGSAASTVTIKKPELLKKLIFSPSLVFGEAYMNEDIEVSDLPSFLKSFHQGSGLLPTPIDGFKKILSNLPTSSLRATHNAQHHYDISNDFYKLWLDSSRAYSCAYFLNEDDSLFSAQQQKLELLCRKARLQPGQTLLDIGCGWGSLLFYAAEKHQVTVTGITPAEEQAEFIKQEAKRRGMEDRVKVIIGDWRELTGTYDRIISVGMFEHVGQPQYAEFLELWHELLAPDGVSLLHTIGSRESHLTDPWINKYIFPGGYLPTLDEIASPANKASLRIMDVENLKQHYAKTLQHWSANFSNHRSEIVGMFDERFAKMWWLYLQSSEVGFSHGGLQLYQLVLVNSKAKWPLNREVAINAISDQHTTLDS